MRKKFLILSILVCLLAHTGYAQTGKIGVNTRAPKATLDIQPKTDNTTADVEGLLLPRINKEKAYKMAIATTKPVESNMVYVDNMSTAFSFPTTDTTVVDITKKGYYYWNGDKWVRINSHSNDPVVAKTLVYTNTWPRISNAKFGTVPHSDPGFTHNPALEKNTDYLYVDPYGTTYLWDVQKNKYVQKEVGGSSLFYKQNSLEDAAGKLTPVYRPGRIGIGVPHPLSDVHAARYISGIAWDYMTLYVNSITGDLNKSDYTFSTLAEAIEYANTITNNGLVQIQVQNEVETLNSFEIFRDIVITGDQDVNNIINLNGTISIGRNVYFGFVEGYNMTVNQNTPVAFLVKRNSQILIGGYSAVTWNFTANNQKFTSMSYNGYGANSEVYLTFSRARFKTNSHTGLGWAVASPEHTGNYSISYWDTTLPPNMDYNRVVRVTSAENSWQNLVGEYIAFSGLDTSNNNTAVERMRLTNSGNLGIGTTTPSEKLEVSGKVKAANVIFTGIPTHADEAAATNANLQTGEMYKTATGELRIKL